MEIILRGQHTGSEIMDNFIKVFHLFQDRYQISEFQEIHLSVTLVDKRGETVELVDNKSDQTYRVLEILPEHAGTKHQASKLRVVVDNTRG